ncbi:acyl carrier protein [Streptococcus bovimastitidis]|uniref:Acyl carrier protein n=1 Tax=Streptococcus bovimastitidis TaxID=1856638 RepID=A0A1L8MQI1_9STRE|nr:phosphopantetheine-binding protein [Streptococcus bovimastitidis]OJF73007.1 acyl carrier protein [Streptococcus bovimastitidis]
MTREAILVKLQEIMIEQDDTKDFVLTEETSLKDDIAVDSIELTEFIINVEDVFNISIPDEDVEDLTKISNLIDYLEGRLAK